MQVLFSVAKQHPLHPDEERGKKEAKKRTEQREGRREQKRRVENGTGGIKEEKRGELGEEKRGEIRGEVGFDKIWVCEFAAFCELRGDWDTWEGFLRD